MDRDSVERLRFDRRMQRRAGWVEDSDRQAQLDALPDVTEKMTTCAAEEETASAPQPAAPATSAASFAPPPAFGSPPDEGGSAPTY